MPREISQPTSLVGRRLRQRREELGLSLEKIGVAIGIDESSARARISRYELGVHEPPLPTARLLAQVLGVPLAFLYCDNDMVAQLLMKLHHLDSDALALCVQRCMDTADYFHI
jgi:transcriptional regulator with XRE-family HTH domain